MIEILRSAAVNSIQDLGRPGGLRWGVGRSGAMDRVSLQVANALLGDDPGEAGIEVALFPFQLRFHETCAFALAGAPAPVFLDEAPLPPFWAARASAGQVLTLDPPAHGVFSYVAFAGGLDLPLTLGARATDLKGGFGGLDGGPLSAGQTLRLRDPAAAERVPERGYGAAPSVLGSPWRPDAAHPIRVINAAEWPDFDAAAREAFTAAPWTVTREVNRLGYRLSGPTLRMATPRELLSHGLVPGTIQVPPSGQPIVQMAEANTCGGYPKIAVVIETDLRRLAQTRSGAEVRFRTIGWDEAVAARRSLDERLAALKSALLHARNRLRL